MNIEEIEVVITKDGKVEIHVHGVKGQSCLELTAPLEEALGGVVEVREMTCESMDTQNPLDVPPDLTTKA